MSITLQKSRELKDVTVTHVSYVKKGANKKKAFLAKGENVAFELEVRFLNKSDSDEQQLIYGVAYEPNKENPDTYGDFMNAEEIEKTAHEFIQFYGSIDYEHNLVAGAGVTVESYIAPIDMNIGGEVIKKGSWILVTKASDEMWKKYKDGEITGYSIYGIARETIEKGEQEMDEPKTFLQKAVDVVCKAIGISKDDKELKKSFEETLNESIERMQQDPYFIMGIMREDFWKNVNWDTPKAEELQALADSMDSASAFIKAKVLELGGVSKSSDNGEQEDKPKDVAKSEEKDESEKYKETTDDSSENADDVEKKKKDCKKDGEEQKVEKTDTDSSEILIAINSLTELVSKTNEKVDSFISDTNKKLESFEEVQKDVSDSLERIKTGSSIRIKKDLENEVEKDSATNPAMIAF